MPIAVRWSLWEHILVHSPIFAPFLSDQQILYIGCLSTQKLYTILEDGNKMSVVAYVVMQYASIGR